MKTAVVNIKTDPKVKMGAQKIASELGFSLSALLNGYMRNLIRTKTVYFSTEVEEPNEYLLKALKESEKERLKGKISPSFDDAESAIVWLEDSKRKLVNDN